MEKALPMNENENLLWGKWKGTGVSEQQRSHLLIQHRLEERKKKEYECNRKNDEDQQRRADMQLLPFTKEERRLWRQWTRQGITGRDRRKLLKHERRKARKLQGYLQKREETVSAASGTEAVELVRQSYKEEKIVLSSEHFSDVAFAVEHQKAQAYYKSPNHDFVLAHGDCFELLRAFDFKFDMIFADPPYFLSNGGISLQLSLIHI